MSMFCRSSCIKSAFLRSSRSTSTTGNPGFANFGARKIRSWGNEPIMSVNFPVRKCNDDFTNIASYSGKRDNSHSEDKSEKKPDSKWKTLSLAGAALFAIAQSRSTESNIFSNWLTVHAAEPIASDSNEFNSKYSSDDTSSENSQHQYNEKVKSRRQQFNNSIPDVVESAARSVVCIEVQDRSSHHLDWFGAAPQTSSSSGSGFIIHSDGLILTNSHVVKNGRITSIVVRLHDGRTVAGQLHAFDPTSDLALIRISEKNLPVLSLGCSSDTKIGESVAAIGSPLNHTFFNSVTTGVVSSRNRKLEFKTSDISFLQTDASINPGNSGGPLINLDGEAIGVNSYSFNKIPGVVGISLAIPSDYAKKFLTEVDTRIVAGEPVPFYGQMGLTLITVTGDIVADLEQRGVKGVTSQVKGVFVVKVVDGSPAFLAGIQPNDIIVKLNDKHISSAKDVYDVLELAPSSFHCEIIRATTSCSGEARQAPQPNSQSLKIVSTVQQPPSSPL